MSSSSHTIRTEIDSDTLTRGYSGMTDQQVADDMNTEYRTRNRTAMSASEVYNLVDQTEWAALLDVDRQELWDILHMGGDLNPFGREASRFIAIFPDAGVTLTALASARVDDISRADEIGVGFVKEAHVAFARSL